MENRVKITVMSHAYYISTGDDETHIREIEARLNAQLQEIMDQRPSISVMDAFVLLSLNLMDQLSAAEESTDRMREQLTQYMEDAATARMELEDARREIQRLSIDLEEARLLDGQQSL